MTTTFYPPHHVGGGCIHVKNLADELGRIGHNVHILYSLDAYSIKTSEYGPKKDHELDRIGNDRVQTHAVKTPFCSTAYTAYGLNYAPTITKKFRTLVKKIKPDVVHHHEISLLGYRILRKLGDYLNLYTAHSYHLVCQHGTLFTRDDRICQNVNMPNRSCTVCALSYRRPPQLWRYGNSFRNLIRQIDHIISPSQYASTRISAEIDSANVVVIPNFVPNPPQDLPRAGPSDFFLYAGRLERHKGIRELLALSKRIESKLVVVGEGPLKTEVAAFIKGSALSDRVAFLGHVDRLSLYSLLRDANALVIPSTWPENCPLVALESFSVGTPVIATDNGGLPEIVAKVDRELICENLDELERVLRQFDKHKYSPHAIRTVYDELYSPKAYLSKYLQLLDMRPNGA